MSNRKPQPLLDRKIRACCPVCGKTSYSTVGIHPQCAVQQADNERMARVRLRIAEGRQIPIASLNDMSPWKRTCPECNEVQHARKKTCKCGHVFSIRPRPPTRGSKN